MLCHLITAREFHTLRVPLTASNTTCGITSKAMPMLVSLRPVVVNIQRLPDKIHQQLAEPLAAAPHAIPVIYGSTTMIYTWKCRIT